MSMSPVKQAQATLRRHLEGPLPKLATQGTLQDALKFKEWAKQARKQVDSSQPNHITIMSLIAQRMDMQ